MYKALPMAAAFVISLAAAALAQGDPISVTDVWARASNVSTGAVYMTIANSGAGDDKLVAARSPVANQVQMHIEIDDNGVMKMRQLQAIDIKANGKVTLAPGGTHLMLTGLRRHLKEGQTFPLTLTFEKAGKIDLIVGVKKAGSMGDMKM